MPAVPGAEGPTAQVPGVPGQPPVAATCEASSFAAPIQMLNQFELRNTVHALLGDVSAEIAIPQGARGAYRGGLLIDQLPTRWEETAWEIAEEVTQDVAKLTGCEGGAQTDACAQTYIESFGAKAYRRPLAPAELDKLLGLFENGKVDGFASGIQIVVAAVLQHPLFLYRTETGVPDSVAGQPTLRQLTGYEIASRLSYNIWGTMPDEVLFAAAANGELDTAAGVRGHAERMLLDARATPMFADFVGQWLFLDHLGSVPKDKELFPNYDGENTALLRQEVEMFVQDLFQNDGDFSTLFTADYGFLNEKLASFYGVQGVTGEELVKTEMPPESLRAGLVTFAGLLSVEGTIQGVSLAGSKTSYPIGRGRFIRERLACETVPSPPPNATDTPRVRVLIDELNAEYGESENVPPRVFFERVTSEEAVCAGCHALLEPLGFVLERFGADGLAREVDIDGVPAIEGGNYAPLSNASAELTGELASPAALGQVLGQSKVVQDCFAGNLLQYNLGRGLEAADAACLGTPKTEVGSLKLKDLYLDLVASDLYRVRQFN